MIKWEKFTLKEKDQLRSHFYSNECDTDQYRETQPVAGMYRLLEIDIEVTAKSLISKFLDDLNETLDIDTEKLVIELKKIRNASANLKLAIKWLEAAQGGYSGSDELVPILQLVYTNYEENGEHPYYDNEEEIVEWLEVLNA